MLHDALVMGIRDYVHKSGFTDVVGLSGAGFCGVPVWQWKHWGLKGFMAYPS